MSPEDADAAFDPAPHRTTTRGLALTALAALLAVGAATAAGVVPRLRARAAARADHERAAHAVARVLITRPSPLAAAPGGVTLPGTVQPAQETLVHARTNGYVRSLAVDLGDPVTVRQPIAVIDTPELDQELRQALAAVAQARAAVQQARTQAELARTEAARYGSLVDAGFVSQQETTQRRAQSDVTRANVQAAQAALASADANARRLQDLKGFSTVRAPFDGVVTARTVEVGQLITAGSAAAQSLFRVSRTDTVRVFVHVPQLYASAVRDGAAVTVRLREMPARTFRATVARTAHALDADTRSLLTEVHVPNADGALLSGMYAQVTLPLQRASAPLSLPSTALVASAEGTRVAVVEGGAVRWRAVQVEADLGDRVALASGVTPSDDVVVTPSDRLAEGMRVRAELAAPPAAR